MIQSISKNESGEVQGIFFFDPEDRIYNEHFPGNPIVPGSLILYAFITVAKKAGMIKGDCTIERFGFKKFVSPGRYSYKIHTQENRMECRLLEKERTLAAGTITI